MEAWPARSRGIMSGLLQGAWGLGFLLASLVYGLLFTSIGWRGMLWVGILPALLCVFIRYFVKESEVWQENKRKRLEQQRLAPRRASNRRRRRLAALHRGRLAARRRGGRRRPFLCPQNCSTDRPRRDAGTQAARSVLGRQAVGRGRRRLHTLRAAQSDGPHRCENPNPARNLQAAVPVEYLHGVDVDDRPVPGLLRHDRHVRVLAAEGLKAQSRRRGPAQHPAQRHRLFCHGVLGLRWRPYRAAPGDYHSRRHRLFYRPRFISTPPTSLGSPLALPCRGLSPGRPMACSRPI
jgi:Major Facilitator Superfamily